MPRRPGLARRRAADARARPGHLGALFGGGEQRRNGFGVGATQHRLGLAPAKPGACEDRELAPVAVRLLAGRAAAKRAEPAAPREGAGGGEVGFGYRLVQAGEGRGAIFGIDAFRGEAGGDLAERLAARQPAAGAGRGISGIVDQAAVTVPRDQRVYQSASLAQAFGIAHAPARAAPQHPPQILGRAGEAFEIAQRPFFKERRPDRNRSVIWRPCALHCPVTLGRSWPDLVRPSTSVPNRLAAVSWMPGPSP